MQNRFEKLMEAESKALRLFSLIEERGFIRSGISEKQLNDEIYALAQSEFGIEKFWHKRIVRAGLNTIHPYDENPPNRLIEEDDIVFLDLGPIFEGWEADIGRSYCIGSDPDKLRIIQDAEYCWFELRNYLLDNASQATGADAFKKAQELAEKKGWIFGGEIAGHLIGEFPHKAISPEKSENYFHPLKNNLIFQPGIHWIIEIHLIDSSKSFGAFYEQVAF
jgi:Xaa-Pro dipeptidase